MSDPFSPTSPGPSEPITTSSPKQPSAPSTVESAWTPAMAKFKSCRWRRPPDEGTECCGHRDVLPIAGTTGFDPEAWCPDCTFYKLRRTPKKREHNDYGY